VRYSGTKGTAELRTALRPFRTISTISHQRCRHAGIPQFRRERLNLALISDDTPASENLHHLRLSPVDLGICLITSSLIFWAVELEEWQGRRKNRSPDRPNTHLMVQR